MVSEIQQNIFEQINGKELRFARFKVMTEHENKVHVRKGGKHLIIKYNESSDLYDLEQLKINTKTFNVTKNKQLDGVFFDQLQGIIEEFFGFEYVIERLGM